MQEVEYFFNLLKKGKEREKLNQFLELHANIALAKMLLLFSYHFCVEEKL